MRLFLFAAALALLPTPALADWVEAETNNFIIKSEDTPENTREFAQRLERFDAALRTLQNLPVGEEQPSRATKLTVYRFGDIDDISRMAQVSGVAGFYIANAGDSVAYAPVREGRDRRNRSAINPNVAYEEATELDAESVLKHEYVHYFMMQHFPAAYPRWYVEGYAELLATLRLNDDGSFFVGDPPVYRSFLLLDVPQFRLEDMLDAKHELSGYEGYQHYGTGWLLSHYLNFNPQRLAQLNEYLRALGQGEDSLTAARRIFGDLRALDRELRNYRKGPFPGLEVKPAATYSDPAVKLRDLSAAEEALISTEMRLRRGMKKDEAAELFASAKRQAANFASDFDAMAVVARAALMGGAYEEADALGAKLVELRPESSYGWLVRSEAAVERIEDDPAQAAKAREFAAKAAALDRYDPRAAIDYYYSYIEAKQPPPEDAILALEGAYDTAGSDVGYRILLARQLLTEDRSADARTVLQPIAFRGHNQGTDDDDKEGKASIDKVMRLVEAQDSKGAVAMIDRLIEESEQENEA
jgi:hypothetical protein